MLIKEIEQNLITLIQRQETGSPRETKLVDIIQEVHNLTDNMYSPEELGKEE